MPNPCVETSSHEKFSSHTLKMEDLCAISIYITFYLHTFPEISRARQALASLPQEHADEILESAVKDEI